MQTPVGVPRPIEVAWYVLFSLLLVSVSSLAAPGDLDLSFGFSGAATNGFGDGIDQAKDVALQGDGKAIVAGTVTRGEEKNVLVMRYDTAGALDPTFAGDGIAEIDFGYASEYGEGVALQPDGRAVVVGTTNAIEGSRVIVGRLALDGLMDGSFGSGGRLTLQLQPPSYQWGWDVAVQSDGKIVVCGEAGGDFFVARFLDYGALDATFGSAGIVRSRFLATYSSVLNAVAIQPDGKIVASGWTSGPSFTRQVGVVRLNGSGSFDTTFDADGKVLTSGGASSLYGNAIALQPSGLGHKILVGGSSTTPPLASNCWIARYDSNGALDPTFNGDGIWTDSMYGDFDEVSALQVVDSGGGPTAIIVAAYGRPAEPGSTHDPFVMKFDLNGLPDFGFGAFGIGFPGRAQLVDDVAEGLALTSTGKILVVGYGGTERGDVATSRLNANGLLDSTWDFEGFRFDDIGDNDADLQGIVVLSDGRIVSGGGSFIGTGDRRLAFTCRDANGMLDPTFGVGGRVLWDVAGTGDRLSAIAAQPDGKIIGAGRSYFGDYDLIVVRTNADGSPDSTFGTQGVFRYGTPGFDDLGLATQVHADGRIVASGWAYDAAAGRSLPIVLRLLPNGTLDPAFSGDGIITFSPQGGFGSANALAIASDGRIVVAGHSQDSQGANSKLFAARLGSDGTLDATFGVGGIALSQDAGGGNSIVLQPDGKSVVGGHLSSTLDGLLVRFTTNGVLDASFGGDGSVAITGMADLRGLHALRLQANGRIVAACTRLYFSMTTPTALRVMPDGSLDGSFGTGGIAPPVVLNAHGHDHVTALTLDHAERILIASEAGGLFGIARLQNEGSTDAPLGEATVAAGVLRLGRPFPNPTHGIVTTRIEAAAEGAPITAAIVDVTGRRVRDLDVSRGVPVQLHWDGATQDRRPAAPGVYFLRVAQSGHVETRRFTLLK